VNLTKFQGVVRKMLTTPPTKGHMETCFCPMPCKMLLQTESNLKSNFPVHVTITTVFFSSKHDQFSVSQFCGTANTLPASCGCWFCLLRSRDIALVVFFWLECFGVFSPLLSTPFKLLGRTSPVGGQIVVVQVLDAVGQLLVTLGPESFFILGRG